ncbi:MAG: rhodanese-like domain-containing protein [Ruminococcaceae bacterium]|nr:rhodanese-like domain-containing protein [Oscillospiraceae bacterium]
MKSKIEFKRKLIKGLILVATTAIGVSGFAGCKGYSGMDSIKSSSPATSDTQKITYQQISQEEAKRIMDTESDYVIIDSRTDEEFAQGHIKGAIMIPEYEIAERAEKELPDKNQLILVYCRSGRRSKIAAAELVKLGYTNVKEFGGIITWPYEVVK